MKTSTSAPWIILTLAGVVCGIVLLWAPAPSVATVVAIEVHSDNPYNVFPPGEGFSVFVEPRLVTGEKSTALAYQWVDFRRRPLTEPVRLYVNEPAVIESPSNRMQVGYYGLRLLPDDGSVHFNPKSGSRREIGFAVLPVDEPRSTDVDSRFGIVHFDYRDPYLNPGWMKTATEVQIGWNGSGVRSEQWHDRLRRNREYGQLELPLIYGDTWRHGSLDEIQTMMREIFRADPHFGGSTSVPAYELGLEENLSRGSFAKRLELTAEKFRRVKRERDRVDANVRLAYQIAGTSVRPYRRLFESVLGSEIEILSAHPYPWNDWPSPDTWHDKFVGDLRKIMADNAIDVPIWYTEVGSSQNDADVPIMYSGLKPVGDGQTRSEYAAYLIKLYASALDNGVEKVFWYNYKDRDTSTTNAEDHFGLRDYWGHPKPGYLAYAAMLRCMKGRTPRRSSAQARERTYVFSGQGRDCLVAWLEHDDERTVPIETLTNGLVAEVVTAAFDTVGTPISVTAGRITLSTYPIFLILDQDAAG
jgi:hypothetical protein